MAANSGAPARVAGAVTQALGHAGTLTGSGSGGGGGGDDDGGGGGGGGGGGWECRHCTFVNDKELAPVCLVCGGRRD